MNFYTSSFINLLKLPYKNIKLYKLVIVYYLIKFICYLKNKKNVLKSILLNTPYIKDKIKFKLTNETKKLENSLNTKYRNFKILPKKAMNIEDIKNILYTFNKKQISNKLSGVVYLGDKDHNDKMIEIFKEFSFSNPLHPDVFPEIRDMEIDIINIIKYLFQGDDNCCGNLTYGGTESILLSLVTYRDYYKNKLNISNPNIITFKTVHPAFDKGCHYFNINIIKVVNVNEIEKNINKNTILLVGSCPEYSYGLVDPIKEMGELAKKYDIGMHVDCCMGSLLIPFIDEYKHINFKLPGITSISIDTHKYGYSLKGSSVLLFKNMKLKKYQHFINKNWCGGVYATPTLMGSKSGGLISATWASLLLIGKENYKKYANEIQQNLLFIKKEIKKIKEINIIGDPNLNIISFQSDKIDIYHLVDKMKKIGWNLTVMQNPPSFHLCLTKLHTKKICEQFCNDIHKSIKLVNKKKDKLEGTLALYGSSNQLGNNIFIDEIIHDYIFLLSRESCFERYKNF